MVQTKASEIIEVNFTEIDGVEKVMLVERLEEPEAQARCSEVAMTRGLLGIEELRGRKLSRFFPELRFSAPPHSHSDALIVLRGRGRQSFLRSFDSNTNELRDRGARLGAEHFDSAAGSSVSKGESLVDTLNTLGAMRPDAIVMRHSASGAPHFLSRYLPIP